MSRKKLRKTNPDLWLKEAQLEILWKDISPEDRAKIAALLSALLWQNLVLPTLRGKQYYRQRLVDMLATVVSLPRAASPR